MPQSADPALFPVLTAAEMDRLRPLAEAVRFADGETVFRAGEAETALFVVERGGIEVQNPAAGDEVIVTHGPGCFSGDIDLLTGRPVVVTGIARGPTEVLRVPFAKLRALLNKLPSFGEKVMVTITNRRAALSARGNLGIKVEGPGWCRGTNLVREFLYKNFVPYTWIDSEAGRERREHPPGGECALPRVDCGGGRVLVNPSLQELAKTAGVWRGCPTGTADVAVVGAGPAGIAAAVYAASEGLDTVLLDRLGPGGQAGGSSRIENFIGFPSGITGADLATRGVLQMLKFGARMVAPVAVDRVELPTDTNAAFGLHTDCGATVRAKIVLVAAGVRWRRLPAEGAERFEGAGVHYVCTAVESVLYDERDVVVIGGGNSAGQAVMYLAECCRSRRVHHVVRGKLAAAMSDYLVGRIRGAGNVSVHEGTEVAAVAGTSHFEAVELAPTGGGPRRTVACGAVFVFIGADPAADWLPKEVARDGNGFVHTGADVTRAGKWPLADRDPCPLETTVPGLLAAGDIRAGSTKRVGFAVGDGSLAVSCAHTLLAGRP